MIKDISSSVFDSRRSVARAFMGIDLDQKKWDEFDAQEGITRNAIKVTKDEIFITAIKNLKNPGLAEIAKNDTGDLGASAVRKLTDQNLLEDIARNSSSSRVRSVAVGKLMDQNLLEDYAKNNDDSAVRHAAESRLRELKNR